MTDKCIWIVGLTLWNKAAFSNFSGARSVNATILTEIHIRKVHTFYAARTIVKAYKNLPPTPLFSFCPPTELLIVYWAKYTIVKILSLLFSLYTAFNAVPRLVDFLLQWFPNLLIKTSSIWTKLNVCFSCCYKTLFANSFEFVPFLITSTRDLEDLTEQGIKIAFNNRYLVSEQ